MQYKLGDYVRFVDENLEGYITRIIDKETIGVTDANDFEIPVLASKVTLIHGDIPGTNQKPQSKSNAALTPTTEPEIIITEGVFLCLVADQHIASVAHFYLVNETSFKLLTSLTTAKAEKYKGEFAGICEPSATVKLYSANMSDIQLWPKFRLEILFNSAANAEPPAPIVYHQYLKGKDLSTSKVDIPLLKAKGWSIKLDVPSPIIDAAQLKNSFFK